MCTVGWQLTQELRGFLPSFLPLAQEIKTVTNLIRSHIPGPGVDYRLPSPTSACVRRRLCIPLICIWTNICSAHCHGSCPVGIARKVQCQLPAPLSWPKATQLEKAPAPQGSPSQECELRITGVKAGPCSLSLFLAETLIDSVSTLPMGSCDLQSPLSRSEHSGEADAERQSSSPENLFLPKYL